MLAVCLPWDLPGVTAENRWWLRDRILIHAVSIFQMLKYKNMKAHEQFDTILSLSEVSLTPAEVKIYYSTCYKVLERTSMQLKQLKRGLKETGIWEFLSSRPDAVLHFFPRASEKEITPQVEYINSYFS